MSRPKIEQGWLLTLDGPEALAFRAWTLTERAPRVRYLDADGDTGVWFTTDPRVLDWLAAHTGPGRKYPAGWYRDENEERVEVIEDGPDRFQQVATRGKDGKVFCRTPRPEWRRVRGGA